MGNSKLLRLNIKNENEVLSQKAESMVILQRPYIKKILRDLAVTNSENATLICDYIIEEQTQFDIKESTREQNKGVSLAIELF